MLVERVIGGVAPQHRRPATVPSRFLLDVFAPEFPAHLIENFNAKARPFMDGYQTWQGILDWVGSPRWKQWLGPSPEPTEGWCAIMVGDFARAASILLTYVERMEAFLTKDFRFPDQPMPPHLLLCRALADILTTQDPVRIAAHMHAMEAATIAHHKLQKYWQPTPFPFE